MRVPCARALLLSIQQVGSDDSDQDRDHCIPISLCCLVRVVVVTGSTFEILGFFLWGGFVKVTEVTTEHQKLPKIS